MAEMIEDRWHSTHFKLERWYVSDESFATKEEAKAHETHIENVLWDAIKDKDIASPEFEAERMAVLAAQPIHERMHTRAEAEECLSDWGGHLSFDDGKVKVHVRRGQWKFAREFWAEQEACNFAAALDTMACQTARYDQDPVRDHVTDLFSGAVGHDYDDLIFCDEQGWHYCYYHVSWNRLSEKFSWFKSQSRHCYTSRTRAVHGFEELWAICEGDVLENLYYEKPKQAERFHKQLMAMCLILPPELRRQRQEEASRLVKQQDGIARRGDK